ncbi:antichymotrypsin-2-like [Pieris brassicae]|nr:antichymotrypsin-2-like [Pieris brassicae]
MKMFLIVLQVLFVFVASQTANDWSNNGQQNQQYLYSVPNNHINDNGIYYPTEPVQRYNYNDFQNRNNFSGLQSRFSKPNVLQNVEPQKELLSNVSHGVTNLGVNLLRSAVQLQSGNIMMSPTSIATLLALLQQGTNGGAQQQITNVLGMAPEITAPIYRRLTIDMRKRNSRNVLNVANNVVVSDSFDMDPAFKSTAIRNFGSEVTPMNFARADDAANRINKWIADNTNQKITDMIPPEIFNPTTQLVLVNVVYFKGLWETKFKPEATQPRKFYLKNRQTVTVPFMRMRQSVKFGADDRTNSLVAILPFERYQYSLVLIMPNEGVTTEELLSKVTDDDIINYHELQPVEINIEIPKFTMKSDTNLRPVLKNMGINNIFNSESELSGIGVYRTYPPQISDALHSGYLSIDEQGVTAAAASAFAAIALSFEDPQPHFKANRPFIAILWDTQFTIPLFMARVDDPSVLR